MEEKELEKIVKTLHIGQLIEVTERLEDRDPTRDSRFQEGNTLISRVGYYNGPCGRKGENDLGICLATYMNPDNGRIILGDGVIYARHIESIVPLNRSQKQE